MMEYITEDIRWDRVYLENLPAIWANETATKPQQNKTPAQMNAVVNAKKTKISGDAISAAIEKSTAQTVLTPHTFNAMKTRTINAKNFIVIPSP